MTKEFLERLQTGKVLVADGATGTNLQTQGLKPGTPPEEWVFDQPNRVLDLHTAFVEAGSDIILTDTFGGTRVRMKGSKYADRVLDINRSAAQLARAAAQVRPGVLVAGSMGPTGALLEPYGPLKVEEAVAAYAEQAQAFEEGGVDLLVIETHFSLEEATAAVQGVKQASSLPFVVSFSFDRGVRTMMGVKPAQVVQAFVPMGASAVGANCGTTLENMEKIVQEYTTYGEGLVIWAKPNAGLPVTKTGSEAAIYEVTPEQMAAYALRYVQAGARIVGGCCGSTPAHVAAMAAAVAAAAKG